MGQIVTKLERKVLLVVLEHTTSTCKPFCLKRWKSIFYEYFGEDPQDSYTDDKLTQSDGRWDTLLHTKHALRAQCVALRFRRVQAYKARRKAA